MTERSIIARGLCLAAALALVSHSALGATPRQKKPSSSKRKAPAAKQKDEPPPPPPEPSPPPAAAPVEAVSAKTLVAEAVASEPVPSRAEPVAARDDEPGRAQDAPAATRDEAELGRREAARIAAGRIQVAVWASGGIANRRFTYRDQVGYNLAPYRLPAAPMASFGVEAYPAAASGVPFIRDLGIVAHISRGFAFDSSTPQNVTLATNWTRFGGELRERLLFPGPHAFELGVLVGADASYFGMVAKAPVPALLPAARTIALRFGVDGRARVAWRLSLLAGAAYLLTTSRGEIYEHFRRPHVAGVDADFGFAVDLGSGFEARLAGRYTRYFASFKPRIGDQYVAGGALDEQLQAGLGARYAH
jgi:hypothetical protein